MLMRVNFPCVDMTGLIVRYGGRAMALGSERVCLFLWFVLSSIFMVRGNERFQMCEWAFYAAFPYVNF